MKKWQKTVSVIAVLCLMLGIFAGCTPKAADPAPAPDPAPAAETGSSEAAPEAVSEFEGAPTFDLKIAHPQPAGSPTDAGYTELARLMEEYSDGTIKATVFPAGSLVSSAEAVEALRNGTVDIAQLSSGDVATVIPAISLIDVPGTYSQATTAYVEGLKPIMKETMAPYGIHFMSPQAGTPSWFLSNKLLVKSPADMKNLKVRAAGKYGGMAIELWGGSPVTITLADLTTAMERNTVDIILTPGLGAYSNSWYELEHYITVTDISTLMAMECMRQDLWEQMTPAQQAAVDKAVIDSMKVMYDLTMADVDKGFPVMEEYGNEVYTLTAEENAAFLNATQPIRDEIIAEVGEEAQKLEDVCKQFRS